jgi:hypothetical protein
MNKDQTVNYYIDFDSIEYRTVGKIFKPADKVTHEESENSEHLLVFLNDLVSDMIWEQIHYSESCQIQGGLRISFNSEDIHIPLENIEKFLIAVEKWLATKPIIKSTFAPQIHNKGSDPNYIDPEWKEGKGVFPKAITKLLTFATE